MTIIFPELLYKLCELFPVSAIEAAAIDADLPYIHEGYGLTVGSALNVECYYVPVVLSSLTVLIEGNATELFLKIVVPYHY